MHSNGQAAVVPVPAAQPLEHTVTQAVAVVQLDVQTTNSERENLFAIVDFPSEETYDNVPTEMTYHIDEKNPSEYRKERTGNTNDTQSIGDTESHAPVNNEKKRTILLVM